MPTVQHDYPAVQRLIRKTVRAYPSLIKQEGEDEILAEANVAYTLAVNSFDPERGVKLSTHVCNHVRWHLGHLEDQRKRLRHRKATPFSCLTPRTDMEGEEELPPMPMPTKLQRLFNEVSEEARLVLRLTTEWPGLNRTGLFDLLSDLGWAGGQILRTFSEIRKALQ